MAANPRLTFPVDGKYLHGAVLFFIFLSQLIAGAGLGQTNTTNSKSNQLTGLLDATWIDKLNDQSTNNILLSRKDSALYYANLAFAGAEKINYTHGMARASSRMSQIARHFDNDTRLSKKFGEEALQFYEKTSDKRGIDTVYYYLFRAALSECKYEDAMEYIEKYYGYARSTNDQNEIYISLTGMFELNRQMGNYEKCFSYARQLYDIAIKADNKIWLANALWNLGRLYTLIEAYPEGLNYYTRAFAISDPDVQKNRENADQRIFFEMELAEAFSLVHQFDSASYYYQLYKPSSPAFEPVYRLSLGEYYLLKGNFQQALQNFQPALSGHRKLGDISGTIRALLDLSRVYLALDSSMEAIRYGREGLGMALQTRVDQYIRDGYKIFSDVYDRSGMPDSANFYFRKYALIKDAVLNDQAKVKMAAYSYEQRIEMIKKEKQIQEIQLQKETLLKNILVLSLIFLMLIAMIVFRNIMLKRKYEARRRELAENELRIKILESGKSQAEFLQQKSELEMKALRAQMNPHFIFNCLNSINQFIIKNDAGKAADYLTKFAKLIRMVLEKSGKPFIHLEDELNCLQLYVDLEAIRFEKPFVYEIDCPDLEKSMIMVPSLLLQPFVENAIWHGLHPNSDRQGKIIIKLKLENEVLHCEISDNGAGMTGSAFMKGNKPGTRKSLGIELTKQRLQMAGTDPGKDPGIYFENLRDESGKNTGTRVNIDIPVKFV